MFEKENDILFLFPVLQFPILFPIRQFYLSINEDARINDRIFFPNVVVINTTVFFKDNSHLIVTHLK